MQRRSFRHLPLLAIVTLASLSQPIQALSMTPEEAQQIDNMTQRMTTRCVGRYLIDLPEAFVLNSESRGEVEGLKIKVERVSKLGFERRLAAREVQLARQHMDGRPDRPVFKRIEAVAGLQTGRVFNRAKSTGSAEFARTLELFAWRDGFQIEMGINATDGTDIPLDQSAIGTVYEVSERRIHAKYSQINDTQKKLAQLLSIYERVRGRRDEEIPTDAGLCIPNGFVLGAQREGQEVGFVYHLRDSQDVFFTVRTDDNVKEDTTLLQRTGPQEEEMAQLGHTVLRKSKRQIQGEDYEEFLAQGPAKDGVLGVEFNLHGNELRKQPLQPFFVFKLRTGRSIPRPDLDLNEKDHLGLFKTLSKATLLPEQALRLWDVVTPTIRQRPGAF